MNETIRSVRRKTVRRSGHFLLEALAGFTGRRSLIGHQPKRGNAGCKPGVLQQFVMNPTPWTFRLIQHGNPKTFSRLKGLRGRGEKFNKTTEKEQELSNSVRATLRRYYRTGVDRLSGLLVHDLIHRVAEQNSSISN